MNRLSALSAVVPIGLVLGWVTGESSSAPSAPRRPNIVYIMADDHGRQAISAYGHDLIATPNIDRLARGGIRFDRAMAGNSICSPSRAMLLSGKYNHLCGVRRLSEHFDGSQQTFPKLLQQAGYQTAIVGKWHLFTEPTGFTYYNVAPGNGGRYVDPVLKEIGQPWRDGNTGGTVHKGYMTDVVTDVALDWLNRRDPQKPFCLMIHHKAPHSPHIPAERHKDLFADRVFAEPANLLDDYAGRAPEPVAGQLDWSRLIQQCEGQYQPVKKQFTGDKAHDTRLMFQQYLRNYLRLVAAVDENVGRVLDYLDKNALADNTVVLYTSDNGYFLGEHGFYNKMWMYEEGFSIPMIIRLPGAARGTRQELVSILDVAPTVLDLAGVDVPGDMQGCSMKRLLLGERSNWREAFYYHYYGVLGKPRPANWIGYHEIVGVRTATAKLVYYPTWKNGPFWEYFDLKRDPSEMKNLYHDPQRKEEVAAMKKTLRELAARYQDAEIATRLAPTTTAP
ncbi:MAG: Arylsulfatase [Planctomycetes bacterium ADurb.Bin126]|nr:MAG: Arylsulfatase [Planctomycetes bacterium ADurb.Bin126]HOD80377.1 sulfatase [Phycisphaerae bacterium]HQL74393.1 sulfatase [Phycisphaerae bacterium]